MLQTKPYLVYKEPTCIFFLQLFYCCKLHTVPDGNLWNLLGNPRLKAPEMISNQLCKTSGFIFRQQKNLTRCEVARKKFLGHVHAHWREHGIYYLRSTLLCSFIIIFLSGIDEHLPEFRMFYKYAYCHCSNLLACV